MAERYGMMFTDPQAFCDLVARVANSNLMPTASEFVPRGARKYSDTSGISANGAEFSSNVASGAGFPSRVAGGAVFPSTVGSSERLSSNVTNSAGFYSNVANGAGFPSSVASSANLSSNVANDARFPSNVVRNMGRLHSTNQPATPNEDFEKLSVAGWNEDTNERRNSGVFLKNRGRGANCEEFTEQTDYFAGGEGGRNEYWVRDRGRLQDERSRNSKRDQHQFQDHQRGNRGGSDGRSEQFRERRRIEDYDEDRGVLWGSDQPWQEFHDQPWQEFQGQNQPRQGFRGGRDPSRKEFWNEKRQPRRGFQDAPRGNGNKGEGNEFFDGESAGNGDRYTNKKWARGKRVSYEKSGKSSKANSNFEESSFIAPDNQREYLTDQLNNAMLECLVCYDNIDQTSAVWNCKNCYHVLHLFCVKRWAKSSMTEKNVWRCPACQNENVHVPEKYRCFCGKSDLHTTWNAFETAHSCGEVCGRRPENPTSWFQCQHPCNLLCHPGPCPSCNVLVTRECGCGKTKEKLSCSSKNAVFCGSICDRLLSCGTHRCAKQCHFGECEPCDRTISIRCHCGKNEKTAVCGNANEKFECGSKCENKLGCGNHECGELCHPGECSLCRRLPFLTQTCPCGKTPLKVKRLSCLDPVPACDNICGKRLACGSEQKPHVCDNFCHDGVCPPCPKKTRVKCACAASNQLKECAKISAFRCKTKCNQAKNCGKHKCKKTCCLGLGDDHICVLRCGRMLGCGKHQCELLCHPGNCPRCLQTSFEELSCRCGKTVLEPPIPCGTKLPSCKYPCSRDHACEHPPTHSCHMAAQCPPCYAFTDQYCYGGHELRRTIPCCENKPGRSFSCGIPCGKGLQCGLHVCTKQCHEVPCQKKGEKCQQPCAKLRPCGHACGNPCHAQSRRCPDTPCKEIIKVTCKCENISSDYICHDHQKYVEAAKLADKACPMSGTSSEHNQREKPNYFKILECSDECSIIMRNRRLAMCLQIQNPDLSAKLTPRYSDFMKKWAKKDPALCSIIHDKLTALVKLAKDSKQNSRSVSFEVMNREKRQLVHEYCVHFGCESQAYDAEPKRNVVATAIKEKCWLPSYSLLQVVQRETTGQRKAPGPPPFKKDTKSSSLISSRMILPVLPNSSNYRG